MEVNMRCADCAVTEWCKYAFGKFWRDKSNNGTGCDSPLPQDPTLFKPNTVRTGPPTRPAPKRPMPTRPLPRRITQSELFK